MINTPCIDQQVGRRRIFWTTRPAACGEYSVCDTTCSIPGLEYEDRGDERTIKTDEWLLGLILNILNTRARTDAPCPAPMAVYGHWSESYRDDGLYIGATLWNAATKSYPERNDEVQAVAVAVQADMAKLTALGLAQAVDVQAKYINRGAIAVTVVVKTTTGVKRVDLSGRFVSETWVWQ